MLQCKVHIVLLPQCKEHIALLPQCKLLESLFNNKTRVTATGRKMTIGGLAGSLGDTWKSDLSAFEMDLCTTAVLCKYIVYRWEKGPAVELENPSCSAVGGFPSQCERV